MYLVFRLSDIPSAILENVTQHVLAMFIILFLMFLRVLAIFLFHYEPNRYFWNLQLKPVLTLYGLRFCSADLMSTCSSGKTKTML